MTDRPLIAKKLALVETCVEQLRTLARPGEIANDVREERFVEHTLQIALQAVIDTAAQVVSDQRLGEPETYRDLFDLLEKHGFFGSSLAEKLRAMVGMRNILVHAYQTVDLAIVREVVEHHLEDLLEFVAVMRRRL
jgi:uncharacterized protein YutE (UPF0331/DUF86 family)